MDFGKDFVAEGVVTQGRYGKDQWVTSYRVHYKQDGAHNFQTVLDENNRPKVIFAFFWKNINLECYVFLRKVASLGCCKVFN